MIQIGTTLPLRCTEQVLLLVLLVVLVLVVLVLVLVVLLLLVVGAAGGGGGCVGGAAAGAGSFSGTKLLEKTAVRLGCLTVPRRELVPPSKSPSARPLSGTGRSPRPGGCRSAAQARWRGPPREVRIQGVHRDVRRARRSARGRFER